MSFTVKIIP